MNHMIKPQAITNANNAVVYENFNFSDRGAMILAQFVHYLMREKTKFPIIYATSDPDEFRTTICGADSMLDLSRVYASNRIFTQENRLIN